MRSTARFLESVQDGPDALVRGRSSAHTQIPPTVRAPARNLSLGIPADHETFRIRTQSHLYPEWLVDQVDTHRAALVDLVNTQMSAYDWDCHRCQHAVITADISDRCPKCGW